MTMEGEEMVAEPRVVLPVAHRAIESGHRGEGNLGIAQGEAPLLPVDPRRAPRERGIRAERLAVRSEHLSYFVS